MRERLLLRESVCVFISQLPPPHSLALGSVRVRAAPLAIQIPCKLYWESCRRTDMTCGLHLRTHTHSGPPQQLPLSANVVARFSPDAQDCLAAARALHLITLIYMSEQPRLLPLSAYLGNHLQLAQMERKTNAKLNKA